MHNLLFICIIMYIFITSISHANVGVILCNKNQKRTVTKSTIKKASPCELYAQKIINVTSNRNYLEYYFFFAVALEELSV